MHVVIIALLLVASASAQAPWTTAGVTPSLHFDANAGITLSTDSVTTWASSGSLSFSVTAGSGFPTLNSNAINGLPAVAFDGAQVLSASLLGSNAFNTSGGCMLLVMKHTGDAASRSSAWGWVNSDTRYFFHSPWESSIVGSLGHLTSGAVSQHATAVPGGYYGDWFLWGVRRNGGDVTLERDGETVNSVTTALDGAVGATQTFYMGGDSFGNRHIGEIAELLYFTEPLGDQLYADSQDYLLEKYALACLADGDWPKTRAGETASISCGASTPRTRNCSAAGTWGTESAAACDCDLGSGGESCECTWVVDNTATSDPVFLLANEPPTPGVDSEFVDDQLVLRFTERIKYHDGVPLWPGECKMTNGDGDYLAADGTTVVATAGEAGDAFSITSVEDLTTATDCFRTYTMTGEWQYVYNAADPANRDCGLVKSGHDDDAEPYISFEADFRWQNFEDLSEVRGIPVEREVVHKLPFKIRFQKQAVVSNAPVRVFSPVVALSAVTSTAVAIDGASASSTTELFTQVQWPFYLQSVAWSATVPDGQTGVRPDDILQGAYAPRLKAGTTICPNGGAQFTVCENVWQIQVVPDSGATSPPCEFDGAYSIDFTIACFDGEECPLDSETDTANVQYTLDTSNHCAQVVETIDLTATLKSYIDDTTYAISKEKDDFLDTQVAYYRASVSSSKVSISKTEFDDVTITVDPAGTPTVFSLWNNGAAGADQGTFSFSTLPDNTDVAASVASHPTFRFTVDTAAMGLNTDDIKTVSVDAVLNVYYVNAGQTESPKRVKLSMSTLSDTREGTQQQQISSSFAATAPTSGASTASSSSGFMGVSTATLGAACLGLLVVVAIVVVVRSRSRSGNSDVKLTKLESAQDVTEGTTAV